MTTASRVCADDIGLVQLRARGAERPVEQVAVGGAAPARASALVAASAVEGRLASLGEAARGAAAAAAG